MIRLSSISSSAAVFGVSLVVHAAAFVVATVGHPALSRADAPGAAPQTVDVELAADVRSESDPDRPAPEQAAPEHAHTHTHSYPVPPSHDWTPHDPSLVHVFSSVASPAAAPAPAVVVAEGESMPRFTIVVGPGGGDGSSPVAAGSSGSPATGTSGEHADGDGAPLPEQSVSTRARLVRGATPPYPTLARQQGIEADVPLELVVSARGTVETARVVRAIGYGLDEAALGAIRGYAFAPATKDGHAVRVRMGWTMQFRLR